MDGDETDHHENDTIIESTNSNIIQMVPVIRYYIHAFKVYGSRFVVDSRYTPLKGVGRGAYGVVVSAFDNTTKTKVAIKKIPKMFQDLIDAKRILREIKLLRHFQHENVIGLRDIMPSYGSFEELYMVLDFMDTDLHRVIYSSNPLTETHIAYFTYQILRGLKYIHGANVIHRDLKPSNLLCNADCHLKICDFGLARGYQGTDYLTEYVVTRWYRAPEVMTSSDAYDFKIDVWAVGCILAEMLMRNPIFPGDDYRRQLNLIFNTLGTPSAADLACITNTFALQYIQSLPVKRRVPLSQVVGSNSSPDAIDLLEKMLQFNPNNRISVDDALKHPFLRQFHDPTWEPKHNTPWDFSFETSLQDALLTKKSLQQHMLSELYLFRPEFIPIHSTVYGYRQEDLTHPVTGPLLKNSLIEQQNNRGLCIQGTSSSNNNPTSAIAPAATVGNGSISPPLATTPPVIKTREHK